MKGVGAWFCTHADPVPGQHVQGVQLGQHLMLVVVHDGQGRLQGVLALLHCEEGQDRVNL